MTEPSSRCHSGMDSISGVFERITAHACTPALRMRPSSPRAVSKIFDTSVSVSTSVRTSAASA